MFEADLIRAPAAGLSYVTLSYVTLSYVTVATLSI
jgi:hypothetical protein